MRREVINGWTSWSDLNLLMLFRFQTLLLEPNSIGQQLYLLQIWQDDLPIQLDMHPSTFDRVEEGRVAVFVVVNEKICPLWFPPNTNCWLPVAAIYASFDQLR